MNPNQAGPTVLPSAPLTPLQTTPVYNLTVLVLQLESGETRARAANLAMGEIQAGSIRSALSKVVAAAKVLIAERVAQDEMIPWVEPPLVAEELESRFMVPLHL